ncbi:MAG: DoxX family protein [Chitinophagaceae bacterium]|nr:DoxX family protein [Chitinophagaceae bacterium]
MNRLLNYRPWGLDGAALLLRLIFGGLFIHHGWQKIEAYNAILPRFPDLIHIGAKLSFNLVIFAEFFCGILVTIGLLTRLAVIPILIAMIVVYFKALATAAFEMKELPLVYMVLSLVIFLLGPGKYSVDRLLTRNKRY